MRLGLHIMIKKTKRQHQLWIDWKRMQIPELKKHMESTEKEWDLKGTYENIMKRPMAGRWYYTYSNDKGMAVGLAKLLNPGYPFTKRCWMWETCTANEKLELKRFQTQKAAEEAIYKFLS